MSAVELFQYDGREVRTVTIDGEPWFVAADVARILGYRMASDMTRRLDPEDRGTHSARTPSGDQEMTVISEAGLYVAVIGLETGRFEVKVGAPWTKPDGSTHVSRSTRVTAKGLAWLAGRYGQAVSA